MGLLYTRLFCEKRGRESCNVIAQSQPPKYKLLLSLVIHEPGKYGCKAEIVFAVQLCFCIKKKVLSSLFSLCRYIEKKCAFLLLFKNAAFMPERCCAVGLRLLKRL